MRDMRAWCAEQEAASAGAQLPASAMGKAFSHADKKVRDKAVAVFSKWISRQENLGDEVRALTPARHPRESGARRACSTQWAGAHPYGGVRAAIAHKCCAPPPQCTRRCLRASGNALQDHMRLWKALFYCYWMSDKGPVQRELAERLAALINVCPNQEQVVCGCARRRGHARARPRPRTPTPAPALTCCALRRVTFFGTRRNAS